MAIVLGTAPVPSQVRTATRWQLSDGTNSYVFAVNPNKASGLFLDRQLTAVQCLAPDGQWLITEAPARAQNLQFSGVLLDQPQYAQFVAFFQENARLTLTDHLARQWTVFPLKFDVQPQISLNFLWRHTYTMTFLSLGNPT